MKILILLVLFFPGIGLSNAKDFDIRSLITDKPWANGNITELIEDTYQQLLRKNKIKRMKSSEELNKIFCFYEKIPGKKGHRSLKRKRCSKVTGFYSIDTNDIFLNFSHELFIPNLLHEIIHAYQYRVRFAWDVSLLYEALKQKKIKEADFFDYLSFYYESQANWYAATLELNKHWNGVLKRERRRNNYVTATTGLALYALNPLVAVGYMFLPTSDRSQLNPQVYLRDNNSVIPNIDLKALIEEKKTGYFTTPFEFSELIIQNPPKDMNIALGNTFKAYARAVEKSYFGNLDFLFNFKAQDQRLFTSLHNQYYDNIKLLSGPGCDRVLDYIDSGVSPKAQWIEIKQEQLDQCPAFKSVNLEAIKFYKKVSMNQGSSPFRIPRSHIINSLQDKEDLEVLPGSEGSKPNIPIQPGSEGSKPSIPIQPGSEGSKPSIPIQPGSEGSKPTILIQPQLEILP